VKGILSETAVSDRIGWGRRQIIVLLCRGLPPPWPLPSFQLMEEQAIRLVLDGKGGENSSPFLSFL
jgi:hypothetical protein